MSNVTAEWVAWLQTTRAYKVKPLRYARQWLDRHADRAVRQALL